MAVPTQFGTSLIVGPGSTIGSYIVQQRVDLDKEGKVIRIDNEDASVATLIVPTQYAKVQLTLACKVAAVPATDFPIRDLCAVSGFTTYFVDSIEDTGVNSGDPRIVRVTMTNYNLTKIVTP